MVGRARRLIWKLDKGLTTGTCWGCRVPVSLGVAMQGSSPSEVIARLTAVDHFLPREKGIVVVWSACTMQDFWRQLTHCGKDRSRASVSQGEMSSEPPYFPGC